MAEHSIHLDKSISKSLTGIKGLDEITFGGLPTGRPTLICGAAGCGKTLLAMEFLVHGAIDYGEPGVFMAFEESALELAQNVASLGFDLDDLASKKIFLIEYVHIERSEIEETGEFDLEGLFIRLGYAIDSIGAKRVVLDTIENLFSGLPNPQIIRAELRRLFRWLKQKGVTAIITGERGDSTMTRQGLEEYVSDCVIMLDHRIYNQSSTRRLRVVKYRGTTHGTNEYPFLIDERGISVLPITSIGLDHPALNDRISSGVPQLDEMITGKGFYRGSSILVSGTAGNGKSTMAAHFTEAACKRGEKALYFAFEESPNQIKRNMRSVGIELEQYEKSGLLKFSAMRPASYGLEMHLAIMHKMIDNFKPDVVVIDPITSFIVGENTFDIETMLMMMVDSLKMNSITSFFTSLNTNSSNLEYTEVAISSLIDSWILLRDIEFNGERNRGLYILKSRGMEHSNQIREFLITNNGVELRDVYIGNGAVLTGSARVAQSVQERTEKIARRQELERKQLDIEIKRKVKEARIAAMEAEFEADEAEMKREIEMLHIIEDSKELGMEDLMRSREIEEITPDHSDNNSK